MSITNFCNINLFNFKLYLKSTIPHVYGFKNKHLPHLHKKSSKTMCLIFSWLVTFLLTNLISSFPSKINLCDNLWRFYSPKLNISGSAVVPGDIYADLESNNFIKNPLYGQG